MPPSSHLVFLFSDQQHWQAAGFVDPSFRTPALDRLAAEGMAFSHAFCTAPQCSPSRSSLLTGWYPSTTGVLGNIGSAGGDALRMPTIGELLRRAGYRTAYFGKWHLGKNPAGVSGWDEDAGVTGPEMYRDDEVTARALDLLARAATDDRPTALFLSYNSPHDIYRVKREPERAPDPDAPLLPDTWRRKDPATVPAVQRQFMMDDQGRFIHGAAEARWRRYRQFYREQVALYDGHVGRVLDALDRLSLADRTLVVATSDHGDMDGQHGLVFKGPFLYEHLMRVPFLVRLPGGPRGRTVPFPTVNVDVVPTLAEWAGIPPPDGDGVSLWPLLAGRGAPPRREYVIGQYYSKQRWVNPIRMLRTDRFKYTLYRWHGEELYDLAADPTELRNRAADPGCAADKRALADTLARWIRDHGDPFFEQHPTTRDGQPLPEPGAGRPAT